MWVESQTEAVEAVPVDVALGAFRVDVFAVGKVKTPVIVLWGYRCRGLRLVRCVVLISDRHPSVSTAWRGKRSSGAAGSAAVLRQIIPSRI